MTACTPKKSLAAQQEAERAAREVAQAERDSETAQRLADGERESLNDPDRPRVLHPADWPEQITVRIVYPTVPGVIIAETSPDPAGQTSWDLSTDQPEIAMAGAEVALAALGYTLDRFRMYQDMSLMVGKFYRREGPYA